MSELENLDNYIEQRTPDLEMPIEFKRKAAEIINECKKSGLNGFDYIYEFFTWDEIAEIASYDGFPVRFPHYTFGMEYEKMHQMYANGYYKIYEMIVNSDPVYAYLLNSNSDIDNLTVIAHAYAHNDFFKNNYWYSKTNRNMINEMANHGIRIRRYCQKYGREKVVKFLDLVLSIKFLIDPDDSMKDLEFQEYHYNDNDNDIITEEPRLIKPKVDHEYMEDFINPKEWIDSERKRIKNQFNKKRFEYLEKGSRDILGIIAHQSTRLRPWMRDIISMIREESLYFVPMINTKIINEGWASWWDQEIMTKSGFAGDEGIIEYAKHHAGVMGGKYSTNSYALGCLLFRYIKERWDKGQFGPEYEACKDIDKNIKWDKKLGLGMQKMFEVRSLYNDYMFIDEFMDQQFINDYEFFLWEKIEDVYMIKTRDAKEIRKHFLSNIGFNSMPVITVRNGNFMNLGYLLLEHKWTGRTLSFKYTKEVVGFLYRLWGKPVALMTYHISGDYDPDIPLEFNKLIHPIVIHTNNGKEIKIDKMSSFQEIHLQKTKND